MRMWAGGSGGLGGRGRGLCQSLQESMVMVYPLSSESLAFQKIPNFMKCPASYPSTYDISWEVAGNPDSCLLNGCTYQKDYLHEHHHLQKHSERIHHDRHRKNP